MKFKFSSPWIMTLIRTQFTQFFKLMTKLEARLVTSTHLIFCKIHIHGTCHHFLILVNKELLRETTYPLDYPCLNKRTCKGEQKRGVRGGVGFFPSPPLPCLLFYASFYPMPLCILCPLQYCQLSQIIRETPDFRPYLPVSRLESEISWITEVCHFL